MLLGIGCTEKIKSYENDLYHIDVMHHSGGSLVDDDIMLTGYKISPGAPHKSFRLFAVRNQRTASVKFLSRSVLAACTGWANEFQKSSRLYIANADAPPDQVPVLDELMHGTDSAYTTYVKGDRYFVTIDDSLDVGDVTAVTAWQYDRDYYGRHVEQACYLVINADHVDAEFVSDTVLALYVDWPGAAYDTIYANVGRLPDSSMGLSMSRDR